MTESEWLECDAPNAMLEFLQGNATDRKLRLFGVACCRAIWQLLVDDRSRAATDTSERFADGRGSKRALRATSRAASQAWIDVPQGTLAGAAWAARNVAELDTSKVVTASAAWSDEESDESANARRAAFLRDIIGNPFRPRSSSPHRLIPIVTTLAHAAYDERPLPSGELDPARLAVLSDALEEAGGDDADILDHLRSPGPHVRGCWAVDLLTGRS